MSSLDDQSVLFHQPPSSYSVWPSERHP